MNLFQALPEVSLGQFENLTRASRGDCNIPERQRHFFLATLRPEVLNAEKEQLWRNLWFRFATESVDAFMLAAVPQSLLANTLDQPEFD
nr:hypothetical protein [Cystobacter ferrugineus]